MQMAAVSWQLATARNARPGDAHPFMGSLAVPLSFANGPAPSARQKRSSRLVAGRTARFGNALIFHKMRDLVALVGRGTNLRFEGLAAQRLRRYISERPRDPTRRVFQLYLGHLA